MSSDAASTDAPRPSGLKRVVTIIAGVVQMLIVALLAVTLSGIPKPSDPANEMVAVSNAALNNFQSFSAKISVAQTFNGMTISVGATLQHYFRLQNLAISGMQESKLNDEPLFTIKFNDIRIYKPCQTYYDNTTYFAGPDDDDKSSSRRLDTSVDAAILNKVQELTLLTSVPFFNALPVPMSTNGTGNSTDDNVQDDGNDGESPSFDFCADYAGECASNGDAAAASFALSFVLGFVNLVLTFMRVGSDSTVKTWVSLIAHGLCVMFICVAVGSFANGCVNNFVDDYEKMLEKQPSIPGAAYTFETKTGVIFDCAIAGLAFTVLQLVFVIIFRYQAGRAAPMAAAGETTSRETGIANPPPIAPKAAPASEV